MYPKIFLSIIIFLTVINKNWSSISCVNVKGLLKFLEFDYFSNLYFKKSFLLKDSLDFFTDKFCSLLRISDSTISKFRENDLGSKSNVSVSEILLKPLS